MSNYFSMRDFGLNLEEATALVACAKARKAEAEAVIGSYSMEKSERIEGELLKAVKAGKLERDKMPEIMAICTLNLKSPANMVPAVFEAKYNSKHGFFTHHESFACLTHLNTSSNDPHLVGTPTLDGGATVVRIQRASLTLKENDEDEPRLGDEASLFEFGLSAEQFAGMMRDGISGTPCALNRDGFRLIDKPPRLVGTVSIADKAREQAIQIAYPLLTACTELRLHLESAGKISTKADYAELVRLATNVQEAMDAVRPPLRALLAETAGLMATSSTKQLLAELAEPLKALGMDSGEMLRLMN